MQTLHTTLKSHAGIKVLGCPMLWRIVTSFMAGYPRIVSQFLHDHRHEAAALQGQWRHINLYKHQDDDAGALPRLAVAVNDAAMLHTLFQLAHHPQYAHDPTLSFTNVPRAALLLDKVEMLPCIAELAACDATWHWEPLLLRIALRHETDAQRLIVALDWLVAQLPQRDAMLDTSDMHFYSQRGDLAIVQWLFEHGCSIPQRALDAAAQCGHASVLAFLLQHTALRCCTDTLDAAVERNYVGVVALLVSSSFSVVQISRRAIHAAIQRQHRAMLQLLVASDNVELDAHNVLDHAAFCGHVALVQFFHTSRYARGCTRNAMTKAAVHGHVDVVQFLHTHRSEGCHPETLEWAAESGRVAVVAFLLQHRVGGGSVERALRLAARMDRHKVVALLCAHAPHMSVQQALVDASVFGSDRTLAILRAHVGAAAAAMPHDACVSHGDRIAANDRATSTAQCCTRSASVR